MTECTNVRLQDQLPDLLAGMLPVAQREAVEGHLALCGSCRDEYALLETVRLVRPTPPALDIAAIVAALPAASATAQRDTPTERADTRSFRVITGGQALEAPSMRRTTRSPSKRLAVF